MTSDSTVPFKGDDEEMEAAIDAAKHSFREFLAAFLEPKAGQEAFLLKVVFLEDDQVEHIWVADLEIDGVGFRGVIANEPTLPSLRFKQEVEFEPSRITDWMFIDHGRLVGGYTTRLIRERMNPEDRAAHDASAPYVL
jgi:uncharacterized protein YegJ (DUF2314 family)